MNMHGFVLCFDRYAEIQLDFVIFVETGLPSVLVQYSSTGTEVEHTHVTISLHASIFLFQKSLTSQVITLNPPLLVYL